MNKHEIQHGLGASSTRTHPRGLDHALHYAEAYVNIGWTVLPLKPGVKYPSKDFRSISISEKERVKAAWGMPNCGVGLWPAPSGLLVLDVDVKNNSTGLLDLQALEDKHGGLPDTLRAQTPSGGLHIIFKTSQVFGNEKLRPGIDIRSKNGFIACQGTRLHDGTSYTWIDWDPLSGEIPKIAQAPDWLIDELTQEDNRTLLDHSGHISSEHKLLSLQERFASFLLTNQKAKARWNGSKHGLVDTSGSAMDMSMVSLLKSAVFNLPEIRSLMASWLHGSQSSDRQGERYWQRCWDNSNTTSPTVRFQQDKEAYNRFSQRIDQSSDDLELVVDLAAEIAACKILSAATIKLLRKKISKKTGCSLSALELDGVVHENVHASKDMDHLKAAQEIVNTFGLGNIITCDSGSWQWGSRGIWTRLTDREIKMRVHSVAGSSELTSGIVGSIVDLVKTETFVPNHRFNNGADRQIAVDNGVLHYEQNTWQLRPHCREDYQTTLVPVAYLPDAKAPRFVQFLDEVFSPAEDKLHRIRVIKQALGYTLLSSCHLERFIMLIGTGANGKSVLLAVISALVGKDQVCAVQPSQLDNRFQRAHLEGKLANIVTEIAEGAEINDAQLKGLVSGELTTAEQKFQSPFDFRPIATHWFGTNHLPHSRDFSDALFRRAILIDFPRVFAEHERDSKLTAKLLEELSGVLNLALEGLSELIETGQFAIPPSSAELAKGWRLSIDQAHQFVEECCHPSPHAVVEISALYVKYKNWANESGISRVLSKKAFSNRLMRLGYTLGRTSTSRFVRGLSITYRS